MLVDGQSSRTAMIIYLQQVDLHAQSLGHWQLPWHLHSGNKKIKWNCRQRTIKEMSLFSYHRQRTGMCRTVMKDSRRSEFRLYTRHRKCSYP